MTVMAETAAMSLPETKRLGNDLLTSISHVNNAALLLSILSPHRKAPELSSPSSESSTQCRLEALRSLHAFFIPLLRSGKFLSAARSKARDDVEVDGGRGVSAHEGAEAVYQLWLWNKYREFRKCLFRTVSYEGSSQLLKVACITTLMDLVREERPGKFNNALYLRICDRMVINRGQTGEILRVLTAKYFKYSDVRYFTHSNLEKLITRRLGRQHLEQETLSSDEDSNEEHDGKSSMFFVKNVYEVFSCLPAPKDNSKDANAADELWVNTLGGDGSIDLETRETKAEKPSALKDSKSLKSIKRHKYVFSKAWLSFLQLRIPLDIYKKILESLHRNVIPHMTNPLLLSDFLTQSYNSGGLISVMALSSFHILITKYGLEYPEFYNKLYALLEPSIFVAKYRSRFFEPVNTSVSTSSEVASESNNGMASNVEEPASKERQGADPFVATEADTAKCNASKSSLWELEALRRHYCPAVSRFVESLETDLTVRAKTTEMAIRDFSSASYATIFGEEVGRRLKSAPLAFYAAVPDRLFPEADSDDAFAGWRFEENPNFEDGEAKDAKFLTTERSLEEVNRNDNLEEQMEADDTSGDDTGDSRSRSDESEDADTWPGSGLKRLKSS